MDAKLTINFKRQPDGSHLATAVMIIHGLSTPKFFRRTLAPEVDPWAVYNDVAAQAWGYISAQIAQSHDAGGEAGPGEKGKVVQLRGVLPI